MYPLPQPPGKPWAVVSSTKATTRHSRRWFLLHFVIILK